MTRQPPTSTLLLFSFFFFNDTATTEIYTLSLHDALPICFAGLLGALMDRSLDATSVRAEGRLLDEQKSDRKSTRLNSSHQIISYAVFCLKKKTHTTSYAQKP